MTKPKQEPPKAQVLPPIKPGEVRVFRKGKDHRHRFHDGGGNQKLIMLVCKCGENRERLRTPAEARRWDKRWKRQQEESDQMHRVSHEFDRLFRAYEDRGFVKIGKKKVRDRIATGWKWHGYELMERIDKWAEKHPKDVAVCGIDDTHFTSSAVYFILHRVGRRLWGTTAIVVSQCDGEPPKEFFMYPGHRLGIQKCLEAMDRFKPWDRMAALVMKMRKRKPIRWRFFR